MENSIQKSISGAAASARIWAGHYTCRLLTAAFLPPFATYRVKNYQRSVGGAGVSYGPVLSNIYVNTLPECHTTNNRGVNGISRKFSQYLEKAHNWAISFVKAPTTTYTLKNLLRHLLLNGHFKLGESTRNWDAKCESAIHYSMSFQQGGALLINFFEYCKNFRKISFTALVPHHNYQYYHTGAWLDLELMLCNHRVFPLLYS